MASRKPPAPIQVGSLMAKSRAVAGFWLMHALGLPGGLGAPLEELTSMIRAHRLRVITGGSYPLAEAGKAHEELRSRRSIGKLILTVSGAEPPVPDWAVVPEGADEPTAAQLAAVESFGSAS
jgi:NADPH2:quinone reductase